MSKLLQRTAQELSGDVSRETDIETSAIFWVRLAQIDDNPHQPRQRYDAVKVLELASDIKAAKSAYPATLGLQQMPVARVMRRNPGTGEWVQIARSSYGSIESLRECLEGDDTRVELHFAHRRKRAWQILALGLQADIAGVNVGEVSELMNRFGHLEEADLDYARMPMTLGWADDKMMWSNAVRENKQRSDLTAIEEAQSIVDAQRLFCLSDEEAGVPFGYARSTVVNKRRLLNLPESVRGGMASGEISEKAARELLRLTEDPERLESTAKEMLKNGWSTRKLAEVVGFNVDAMKREQEIERQMNVVRAALEAGWTPPGSSEPLPVDRLLSVEQGYLPSKFSMVNETDRALLLSGTCGSHCECCVLACDRYGGGKRDGAIVVSEDAPLISLACNGGYDKRQQKRAMAVVTGKAELTDEERRRRAEREEKERQAAEKNEAAQRRWNELTGRLDKAALWSDMRFWRTTFNELAQYSQLRPLAEKVNTPQEMMAEVFRVFLDRSFGWNVELGSNLYDVNILESIYSKLTGEKRAQPSPGDSQKTNWEDGWNDECQEHYQMVAMSEESYDDGTPLAELMDMSLVVLRFIEECEDKAVRGELWKRYNELTAAGIVEEA